MNGFIYLWRDKLRNMYYIGSHTGNPSDGYISSSAWLNAEVKYRPQDFKRRVLDYINNDTLVKEEQRIIKLIKSDEFGRKYYNVKAGRQPGCTPWNKGQKNCFSTETLKIFSENLKESNKRRAGQPNPLAAENARKGAAKIAAKATGRRIAKREDGTRYWVYPETTKAE